MTESNFGKREADNETTEKLAVGLLSIYYPKLKLVKGQLVELTRKQNLLYNELHTENLQFSSATYSAELQNMFKKVKFYKEKLTAIKHNMIMLHQQSTKLKKRALKLEQQKQKEALDKVERRENEELLIGKPSAT